MKKQTMVIILSAIILLGLVVALGEAWNRVQVEAGNLHTEILVEYRELMEQVNRHSMGRFSVEDALAAFKASGIGGVLFKEQSLDDLARGGQLQVFRGAELLAASKSGRLNDYLPGFAALDSFNPYYLYVEIPEPALWERVSFYLRSKVPGTIIHQEPKGPEGASGNAAPSCGGILSVPLEEEMLSEVGVGFPRAEMESVLAMGMNIYLQIYGWPGDEQSIPEVFGDFQELPGVRGILFLGANLPGFPGHTALAASEVDRLGVPVVTIDLFELQRRPLLSLVRSSAKKEVIRLHAIPQEERDLLSRERALSRYHLAVTERNIRLLLIRYGGKNLYGLPWLEENTGFVADLREGLAAAGHPVGTVLPYKSSDFSFSRAKIFFISAGILAAGVLLLFRAGMQVAGLLLGAAGLVLVGFLLVAGGKIMGMEGIDLARKGMALAAGIIFPLLGLSLYKCRFGGKSLLKALYSLLAISAVSLAGALLSAGLLAEMTYMVKLDQVQGIRLALLLPLPLAWLLLIAGDETSLRGMARKFRELWDRPLFAGTAVLVLLLLAAAAVVLIRSGNESPLVTELELRARSFLGELLTVRPRTKEFLFGHPFLLAALYWGLGSRLGMLAAIMGMVGQVSLVNTFYHLHTPLTISLLRTGGGLALGIILGVVLALAPKILCRIWERLPARGE